MCSSFFCPIWLHSDPMLDYLLNIWPFTIMKIYQIPSQKITKVCSIVCQTLNKSSKICQSGTIFPNLVTLGGCITKRDVYNRFASQFTNDSSSSGMSNFGISCLKSACRPSVDNQNQIEQYWSCQISHPEGSTYVS